MTALRSLLLALVGLALALPVFAQDSRGRVQGTIADSTGGVLPGVTVTLRNDATGPRDRPHQRDQRPLRLRPGRPRHLHDHRPSRGLRDGRAEERAPPPAR